MLLKSILFESVSKKFDVFNESEYKVDTKNILLKLNPYLDYIKQSKLPVKIKIRKKENANDSSFYDVKTKMITITIKKNEPKRDLEWKIAHEFAHFLQDNNVNMSKAGSVKEQDALHDFLTKKLKMKEEDTYDIFHDFYPMEVFANVFATMITGYYKKNHPFNPAKNKLKRSNK